MTSSSYSIKGLGYTAIDAQLFSVPPYAVAALLTGMSAIREEYCNKLTSFDKTSHRRLCLRSIPNSWTGHARLPPAFNHRICYHQDH